MRLRRTRPRPDRDLQDLIPDDISVTDGGAYWYVTARYDFGEADERGWIDHEHIEIKMTPEQGRQLLADLEAHRNCQ